MRSLRLSALVSLLVFCSLVPLALPQTRTPDVPRVVRYSGVLHNADGSPRAGTTGVTFSIYADQASPTPVWQEVQNVVADETGHYNVLLGAARGGGLPDELFATNAARWISVRVEGDAEQPRTVLASVPYALKAADAETLGGKPLSAFVMSEAGGGNTGTNDANGSSGATSSTRLHPNTVSASSGTPGQLAMWIDASTLGPADFSDTGGYLGIGTTTPQSPVHIFSMSPVFRIERSSGTANAVMTFGWAGSDKADFGVSGANDNFVNGSLRAAPVRREHAVLDRLGRPRAALFEERRQRRDRHDDAFASARRRRQRKYQWHDQCQQPERHWDDDIHWDAERHGRRERLALCQPGFGERRTDAVRRRAWRRAEDAGRRQR
jgi:hypothetical protein